MVVSGILCLQTTAQLQSLCAMAIYRFEGLLLIPEGREFGGVKSKTTRAAASRPPGHQGYVLHTALWQYIEISGC